VAHAFSTANLVSEGEEGPPIQASTQSPGKACCFTQFHEGLAPTLMWLRNGDLACDTCAVKFSYDGPRVIVLNAARAKGWHLFQGESLTGKPIDTHVCPDCIGTSRSIKPKVDRLDEELPLF